MTFPLQMHCSYRERGVALVMTLLLLLVLSLLAVAGMNSASMEFIMAGNDQFHQNAFQAAETGIQQAIAFGSFNPNVPTVLVAGTAPNVPSDTYNANIARQFGGAPQGPPPGYTVSNGTTAFQTYVFEIDSTGTSLRNSSSLHAQGVMVIAPASQSFGCNTPPPCVL